MPAPTTNIWTTRGFNFPTAGGLARLCQTVYDHSGPSFPSFVTAVGGTNGARTAPTGFMLGNFCSFLGSPGTLVIGFEGLNTLRQGIVAHMMGAQNSPVAFPGFSGKVSLLALTYYLTTLRTYLTGLINAAGASAPSAGLKICLAGHSYGGVWAQLAALDIAANSGAYTSKVAVSNCYTFGTPKIFDEAGATQFGAMVPNHYALALGNDPIPYTPYRYTSQSGQGLLSGGALSVRWAETAHYEAVPKCFQVGGDGGCGPVPPFGDLTVGERISLLNNLIRNGTLPNDHAIGSYYAALTAGWQAQESRSRTVRPTRAVRDAVDSLPVPPQPTPADALGSTMPAFSSYAPAITPPPGGTVNHSQQFVRVQGTPTLAQSAVVGKRRNWAVGDGRIHRQVRKTVQLLRDMLRHDASVVADRRAGTQVITNPTRWTAQAESSYWNTIVLLEEILEDDWF